MRIVFIILLSSLFYNCPAPRLHITFYDIEIDYDPEIGFSSVDNPYAPINSISLFHEHLNKLVVIAIPPASWKKQHTNRDIKKEINNVLPIPTEYNFEIFLVNTEQELLALFIDEIEDSDVLCGWNSDFFDTPYVAKRLEKYWGKKGIQKLCFPGANEPQFKTIELITGATATTIDLSGRINADYMRLYRKYEP